MDAPSRLREAASILQADTLESRSPKPLAFNRPNAPPVQVWLFSGVRDGSEKRKKAVDGLLDMLLLPAALQPAGRLFAAKWSCNQEGLWLQGCMQDFEAVAM